MTIEVWRSGDIKVNPEYIDSLNDSQLILEFRTAAAQGKIKKTALKKKLKTPREHWDRGNREGFVYFLLDEGGLVKIGRTKDLERRIKSLKNAHPSKCSVLIEISTKDMITLERKYHERFAHKKSHGEWFTLSKQELDTVREELRIQ